MALRKKNTESKSRSFTTINLYLPFKISICGDNILKEKWTNFFKENNIKKNKFIVGNFIRDFKNDDFLSSQEFKSYDKKKIESILTELGYPNIQSYIDFILDRQILENKK